MIKTRAPPAPRDQRGPARPDPVECRRLTHSQGRDAKAAKGGQAGVLVDAWRARFASPKDGNRDLAKVDWARYESGRAFFISWKLLFPYIIIIMQCATKRVVCGCANQFSSRPACSPARLPDRLITGRLQIDFAPPGRHATPARPPARSEEGHAASLPPCQQAHNLIRLLMMP